MPRLIILLLTSAALTTLTLQNRGEESAVPLVIAGQTVVERMPLGLLLLLSVAVGALLTLILYGLIGLSKPAESKYKPIGRRVPYPDGPGNSYPSSPSSGFSPKDSTTSGYSGSSAFVSEPSSQQPSSQPTDRGFTNPPANPKPANPRPANPPANPAGEPETQSQPFISPPPDNSSRSGSSAGPSDRRSGSYDSSTSYSDTSYSDASYSDTSYLESSYSETKPSRSSSRSGGQFGTVKSRLIEQPIAGLKSVLSKKKDRDRAVEADVNRPIGDDWGELRTTEQRNSWETEKETALNLEAGARELLNFGRNVGANASRLAEDIASGWSESRTEPSSSKPSAERTYSQYSDASQYVDDAQYSDAQYSDAQYSDELDRGWPSSDDGYAEQPMYDAADKRTYGDSLYRSESNVASDGLDGAYPADDFDDDLDDVGLDDVYEADYRVLEPPKKPLSEIDPREHDVDGQ